MQTENTQLKQKWSERCTISSLAARVSQRSVTSVPVLCRFAWTTHTQIARKTGVVSR